MGSATTGAGLWGNVHGAWRVVVPRLVQVTCVEVLHAALAQSVEHLTRNEKVVSSILTGGSRQTTPRLNSLGVEHYP